MLGAPGKKLCFWHSPPPSPAPEPTPTQLLLVPGNKQCEVSPPRIWKGVHPPKSPRGVGGQQPCSAVATGGRPAGAVRARALGQAGRRPGQGTQTQRVHSFGQCCNSEQMPQGPLAQPALDRGARQQRLWSTSCVPGPSQGPWSPNRTSMILSLLWLFYFYFWPHQVACGILLPDQGLNQCPRPPPHQGKQRVLTSALVGKSGNTSDLPGARGRCSGSPPMGMQVLTPPGLKPKHKLAMGLPESDQGISPQGLLDKVLQTEAETQKEAAPPARPGAPGGCPRGQFPLGLCPGHADAVCSPSLHSAPLFIHVSCLEGRQAFWVRVPTDLP